MRRIRAGACQTSYSLTLNRGANTLIFPTFCDNCLAQQRHSLHRLPNNALQALVLAVEVRDAPFGHVVGVDY